MFPFFELCYSAVKRWEGDALLCLFWAEVNWNRGTTWKGEGGGEGPRCEQLGCEISMDAIE